MTEQNQSPSKGSLRQRSLISWVLTVLICAGLISVLAWQPKIARSMAEQNLPLVTAEPATVERVSGSALQSTPQFTLAPTAEVLIREPNPHTEIDTSLRTTAIEYTVTEGDSVFSIAQKFPANKWNLVQMDLQRYPRKSGGEIFCDRGRYQALRRQQPGFEQSRH